MKDNYIEELMNLANKSFKNDEIPIGAIVVENGKIIGSGINSRSANGSVVGHAEINAIEMACKYKGDWRLSNCSLYVTLSPCMMCTGAIIESRIKDVYYILDRTNVRFNASDYIKIRKIDNKVVEDEYLKLLKLFFENKRNC